MLNEKILLVEDDKNMAFLLHENLSMNGYQVVAAHDGKEGLHMFEEDHFRLCILDLMLPMMDGINLAKAIRKTDNKVPIIFLTAKNFLSDKIEAFNAGADDYITKPFSIQELMLRIRAVLNRTSPHDSPLKEDADKLGKLAFHYTLRSLKNGKLEHKLSAKEAELLNIFVRNKNQLVYRKAILKQVWGDDDFFASKSMDVYLTRIRKLIKSDPSLELQNIHGIGYKLLEKG